MNSCLPKENWENLYFYLNYLHLGFILFDLCNACEYRNIFYKGFQDSRQGKIFVSGAGAQTLQWGLQPVRRGRGCSKLVTDLMDPPQCTAEPLGQDDGASGKMCLIQGKQCHPGRGEGRKSVRKQKHEHKIQRRSGCSWCHSRYPHFRPWTRPCQTRWIFPEGTAIWGEAILEQRKIMSSMLF